MLKPFYQGKLDAFCAIYAVLNALRLTHGIRTKRARDILNDILVALASRPEEFRKVVTQETDYVNLVDAILAVQCHSMPLEVSVPFTIGNLPDVPVFWDACQQWLGDGGGDAKKAIIFRFQRFLKPDADALNKHWTTADYVRGDILHLFDCSHEAEAILNIRMSSFVTTREKVDKEHLLYIQPETARFLRLPF